MFVSNVSHELRTPMAALSAELDLAVQKERSPEQYQNAIHNALQDSQRVIKLIDGLLNLAKADYEPEQIKREEIRLDELLLDARELVLRAHPDFHVELVFEQEAEDDKVLTVIGNSYLLTTAFVNLIENNCKVLPEPNFFYPDFFLGRMVHHPPFGRRCGHVGQGQRALVPTLLPR